MNVMGQLLFTKRQSVKWVKIITECLPCTIEEKTKIITCEGLVSTTEFLRQHKGNCNYHF